MRRKQGTDRDLDLTFFYTSAKRREMKSKLHDPHCPVDERCYLTGQIGFFVLTDPRTGDDWTHNSLKFTVSTFIDQNNGWENYRWKETLRQVGSVLRRAESVQAILRSDEDDNASVTVSTNKARRRRRIHSLFSYNDATSIHDIPCAREMRQEKRDRAAEKWERCYPDAWVWPADLDEGNKEKIAHQPYDRMVIGANGRPRTGMTSNPGARLHIDQIDPTKRELYCTNWGRKYDLWVADVDCDTDALPLAYEAVRRLSPAMFDEAMFTGGGFHIVKKMPHERWSEAEDWARSIAHEIALPCGLRTAKAMEDAEERGIEWQGAFVDLTPTHQKQELRCFCVHLKSGLFAIAIDPIEELSLKELVRRSWAMRRSVSDDSSLENIPIAEWAIAMIEKASPPPSSSPPSPSPSPAWTDHESDRYARMAS